MAGWRWLLFVAVSYESDPPSEIGVLYNFLDEIRAGADFFNS